MASNTGIAQGVLLCLILISSCLGERNLCFKCDNVFQPAMCMQTELCSEGEACFVERGLSETGSIKYYSGCLPQKDCQAPNNNSRLSVPQCKRCCLGDLCNIRGCGSLSITHSTQLVCLNCNGITKPSECHSAAVCLPDQLCGIQSRDIINVKVYDLGCFDAASCLDQDAKCCDTNGCNVNLTTTATPALTTPPVPTNDGITLRGTDTSVDATNFPSTGYAETSEVTTGFTVEYTESTNMATGTGFENTDTTYESTGSTEGYSETTYEVTAGYTDTTYMPTGSSTDFDVGISESSTDFDVGVSESSTVAFSNTLEESTEMGSTVAVTRFTDMSTEESTIKPSVEPFTNQTNKLSTEKVTTYIPDDIWVKSGATTTLHITQCEAKGKPQPQVTWEKLDDSSNSIPRFTVKNGVLVFPALDSSLDSGLYVCKATNGVTSDESYMAVYQEKAVDCKNTFKQFSSSVVYRAICPLQCSSLTPLPSPVKVTKSSPVCSSLQADATGQVAWMLRSSGHILQLTTDQEGQIEMTEL